MPLINCLQHPQCDDAALSGRASAFHIDILAPKAATALKHVADLSSVAAQYLKDGMPHTSGTITLLIDLALQVAQDGLPLDVSLDIDPESLPVASLAHDLATFPAPGMSRDPDFVAQRVADCYAAATKLALIERQLTLLVSEPHRFTRQSARQAFLVVASRALAPADHHISAAA